MLTSSRKVIGRIMNKISGAKVSDPVDNTGVGIMFNALPKSASEYCWHTLAANLGYGMVDVSGGIWPEKLASRNVLENISRSRLVGHDHLFANKFNLLAMARYLPKWIIHLRDPRQATISWTHHLQRRYKEDPYESRYFDLDEKYFAMPFEKQLDMQIQQFYPRAVQWINQWLDVIEGNEYGNRILLTTFEEFLQDKVAFLRGILEFHGIEYAGDPVFETPENGKLQYRKGEISEWKSICDKRQQLELSKLMDSRQEQLFS